MEGGEDRLTHRNPRMQEEVPKFAKDVPVPSSSSSLLNSARASNKLNSVCFRFCFEGS